MFNILFQIFSLQLLTYLSCSVMPCTVYCLILPPLHTFKCVPVFNHSLSFLFLLQSFPHFCSWHFFDSLTCCLSFVSSVVANVYKVVALVFLYTASIYIIWRIY